MSKLNNTQIPVLKSKVKKSPGVNQFQECKSYVYACFQQPETIQIIPYLSMTAPNKLCFDSNQKSGLAQADIKERFDKKQKQFKFSKIYNRQEKFKYVFSQEVNMIITKLFKGFSQTVFIYGTQQAKKDKILIGQSQNSGFLLTALSEIFQYCHEKQIQDEVTIKLSCMMYKNGAFTDIFGVLDAQQLKRQSFFGQQKQSECKKQKKQLNSIFCDDMLQKKYFLGVPEIIIRNMRTALKIINLICKKMQQRRDQQEENTQNLVYTIKLELDTGYDRYTGQVFEYNIPKLHIIKLANPSVNNTLNGISKNNQWFVNLFNYLQTQTRLQKHIDKMISQNVLQLKKAEQKNNTKIVSDKPQQIQSLQSQSDQFTTYIKQVALKGVSQIHCFTSITNKMTSNQCLTAFIFNNYLLGFKTKPTKTVLNTHLLKDQKITIQQKLMDLFQVKQSQIMKQRQILKKYNFSKDKEQTIKKNTQPTGKNKLILNQKQYNKKVSRMQTYEGAQQQFQQEIDQNKLLLYKYIDSINKFMQSCNIVEYQYSLVLGAACQKLNKYIFNEEIEEFYYAKKVSTEVSLSLKESIWSLMQRKRQIAQLKQKIIKTINSQINKIQNQIQTAKKIIVKPESEEVIKIKKQKKSNLSKQRQIYAKLFQVYDTMAYHYLYENNKNLISNLQETKLKIQEQLKLKSSQINNINYQQILNNIKKGFKNRIQQKKNRLLSSQDKELNQILHEEIQQNFSSHVIDSKQSSFYQKQQIIKKYKNSHQEMNIFPFGDKGIQKQNKQQQYIEKDKGYKKRKNIDELDKMFTNSNVARMSKTLYK